MFKNQVLVLAIAGVLFAPAFINAPLCSEKTGDTPLFNGEAPSMIIADKKIHLSFASGDSIFYSFSSDLGQHFSTPELVSVLKGLVSTGNRGPQIVCSSGQLLIAAPDKAGNLYTYIKKNSGSGWGKGGRINDLTGVARECFISLGAARQGHLFAAWLDLRSGKKNNLYCARSENGGKTWLKNQLVYKSPDGSVCECCKPSVAVKDEQVAIMFRNNLDGNRDLYIMQSGNGGKTFGAAQKLGEGNWKLNGCPMDGGGITMENTNTIQTVWRRKGNIYTSEPGKQEILIGKGRQCAITTSGETFYISFVSEGKVFCRTPQGKIIELGQGGSYPKLVAPDTGKVLCAWESDNKIYKAIL